MEAARCGSRGYRSARWPRRSPCRARCTTSAGSTAPAPSTGAGAPWSSPGPTAPWAAPRGRTWRTVSGTWDASPMPSRLSRASAARRATRRTPRWPGCSPARRGGSCAWSTTTWTVRGRIFAAVGNRAYELGHPQHRGVRARLPGTGRVPRRGLGRRRGPRRTRRGRQRRGGLGLHLVDGGRHRRAGARRAGGVGRRRGDTGRGRGALPGGLRAVGGGHRDEPCPSGRGPG